MASRRALLLAMSGVRVQNPELRRLGLTLPGFVERGKVIASMPSLGLLTIAAQTPEGWEIDYAEYDDVPPKIDHDLVAISSLSARIGDAYAFADRLRSEGRTVVIGGLHASACPDEARTHADAVVVGEGELVWDSILNDWPNLKSIYRSQPSRAFQRAVPRYDLLDVSKYNRVPLQTSRGCPLDCAFCGASRLISSYKRKEIAQVRTELEAILELWDRPFIELADDNSFVHRAWSRELAKLLGEYPVRWFTETDVSVADDEALLEALAVAGCAQLLIGLESVSATALDETDTKSFKRRRRDRYVEAIQTIQGHGISVNGCFIHGFDSDTPEVFEATRDFVRESGLSEVQVTILTPFPGTMLYERLRIEGRLLEDNPWDRCTLFDATFQPARMSVEELEGGFRWLVGELYSEVETERRRKIMRRDYRRSKRSGESVSALR